MKKIYLVFCKGSTSAFFSIFVVNYLTSSKVEVSKFALWWWHSQREWEIIKNNRAWNSKDKRNMKNIKTSIKTDMANPSFHLVTYENWIKTVYIFSWICLFIVTLIKPLTN